MFTKICNVVDKNNMQYQNIPVKSFSQKVNDTIVANATLSAEKDDYNGNISFSVKAQSTNSYKKSSYQQKTEISIEDFFLLSDKCMEYAQKFEDKMTAWDTVLRCLSNSFMVKKVEEKQPAQQAQQVNETFNQPQNDQDIPF
jgi:S-adenosylmethionine:tRNA-ribosyltransferase-isomerase (queuine synthetase)